MDIKNILKHSAAVLSAHSTREKVKKTVREVKEQVEDLKNKRIVIVDKTAYTTGELEDAL